MSDEEARAELRQALLGKPSRRRQVELGRFASALAACELTEEEKREHSVLFDLVFEGKIRVGELARLRSVIRHTLIVEFIRRTEDTGRYGTPFWLDSVVVRDEPPVLDIEPQLFLPAEAPEDERKRRAREKTRENVRRRPPRRL